MRIATSDRRGFGLVMAMCVLFGVGAAGLSVLLLAQTSQSGAARAADRAAAYYLAEGIVERGIAEILEPSSDWSSLAGDTLYADVPMGDGVCMLVASAATSQSVEFVASASYRSIRESMRVAIARQGSKMRWLRLAAPYAESKEQ